MREAVERAESSLAGECRRVHYLSVPPKAALPAVRLLDEAGLVEGSRIIMEKPFGVDLASAVALNAHLHEVFAEEQIFRIDHFLGKEPAQNILAFRFANGLFEPIWNRNFIDHVQIDVPETLGLGRRAAFYESTGAYRDMVVTHLFQILAFMAMEPPTSLEPIPISEEKNKVFRCMLPIDPREVVRGQYVGLSGSEEGVDPESDVETFIALKCHIDNWRWAGRAVFPAHRQAASPKASASYRSRFARTAQEHVPDRIPASARRGRTTSPSTSPTPPRCRSRSTASDRGRACGSTSCRCNSRCMTPVFVGDVLEAYERLILDAMRGDRTLFTTAEGIERLWDVSTPLARGAAPGASLRARLLGAEIHPPARRPACLAAPLRAGLAQRTIRPAAEMRAIDPAIDPARRPCPTGGGSAASLRSGDQTQAILHLEDLLHP